ncbi:MAG: rRNA maturation RNase YbeY [Saccharofermentanales bacterium]|jgi:probable rRNA maturation factor|nr:rRNA maturation RNase YbeY [Clostridiaceae bacterium]
MITQFVNRQSKYPLPYWRQLLAAVLPVAIQCTPIGEQLIRTGVTTSVCVTFAGPRVMRRINFDTRQIDQLTDVLAFPMLEMSDGHLLNKPGIEDFDPAYPDQPTLFLGDVVLSLDQAFFQAAEYGHSREREVSFLGVHGLLHLLGYDHAADEQAQVMEQKQNQILDMVAVDRRRIT